MMLRRGGTWVLSKASSSSGVTVASPASESRGCISLMKAGVSGFFVIAVCDNMARFSAVETEVVLAAKGSGGCFGDSPGGVQLHRVAVVLCRSCGDWALA